MTTLLQLRLRLYVTQKWLMEAIISNNSQRMFELNFACSILKDTIIEMYEKKVS